MHLPLNRRYETEINERTLPGILGAVAIVVVVGICVMFRRRLYRQRRMAIQQAPILSPGINGSAVGFLAYVPMAVQTQPPLALQHDLVGAYVPPTTETITAIEASRTNETQQHSLAVRVLASGTLSAVQVNSAVNSPRNDAEAPPRY